MTRSATRFALALSLLATPGVPLAAQTFDAGATQYTFSGCDPRLCGTLTLLLEPADLTGPHPDRTTSVAFSTAFTFRDAGDGLGAGFDGSSHIITIPGIPENVYFEDVFTPGRNCGVQVFRASGTCGSDFGEHTGWANIASATYVPLPVSVRYQLAPAGVDLRAPASGSGSLTLAFVPATTTPEPATWALVSGGLLVGVAARGRVRRAR